MKKNLKCYPNPILFYRLTGNISETQYHSYNRILVLRCKIMQQNTGGKYNTGSNTISNIGKLALTVHPYSFGEEPSSLILRKLVIAGSSLWWRSLIRMANYPFRPFPYPQPIISTTKDYWQALACQCIAFKTLFHKNSTHTIKKARH